MTPSIVLRWQHKLEGKLSHSGVMACRSTLGRILEAHKEGLIATNPDRQGRPPSRSSTPDRSLDISGDAPHPRGVRPSPCRLSAVLRDHFLIRVGTGLRSGELLGLRRRRVFPELGRIEVIEVRYEADRFGRGFKAEPKSLASVRVVPMCDRVREAIARQLADGARPEDLVLLGRGLPCSGRSVAVRSLEVLEGPEKDNAMHPHG